MSERDDYRFFGFCQHCEARFRRHCLHILDRDPVPPLYNRLGIDAQFPAQLRERSLQSLYCRSAGVRGRGAPVRKLPYKGVLPSQRKYNTIKP